METRIARAKSTNEKKLLRPNGTSEGVSKRTRIRRFGRENPNNEYRQTTVSSKAVPCGAGHERCM